MEEKQKADAEVKAREELEAKVKALEEQQAAKEEEYKRKLDAAIGSQAVVTNADPFAGKSKGPSGSNAISSLTEEQMDDIETESRLAFEDYVKSRK